MQGKRRELIPYQVRAGVRDMCRGWEGYSLREIDELFTSHGFEPNLAAPYDSRLGQRPNEAARFQTGIDFCDPEQVDRYLRLVEEMLEDTDNDGLRVRRDRLVKVLRRAGFEIDDKGRVALPPLPPSATLDQSVLPTESDIRLQLRRLERLDQEPEEMIGAAKELIEASAKYVLLELKIAIDPNADFGELSKRALAELHLRPESLAPTGKGVESMKRVLAGLSQIAGGMAELRNQYGTGHGRGSRVGGLQTRHAEFAARAAVAYAAFVLETLSDPTAPWRR